MLGIPPLPSTIRSLRITDQGSRATGRRPRTWWIAPALVASLLVGSAMPVVGADGVVDHPAQFSACVGPALESAGFRDMEGSFAEDAANCLAHYEITLGTDPGVFSPSQVVPRWQMALFLVRAADPAGIVLPEAADQGFADLTVGAQTREAINQLAALEIMKGTSATTFEPQAAVTRQQMAVLLARFLSVAPTGPGGKDVDAVEPDDDHFVDLAHVAFKTHTAIRKLYEMGVTTGTSATTFSPSAQVSRAQMAVFIARMLGHTNARPAGLTVQAADAEVLEDSDITVSVSYRDSDHQPFGNRRVDIFMSTDPGKAFDEDGYCTNNVSAVVGGRSCVVDSSDRITSSSGNVSVDLEVGDADALQVWVWTGAKGDVYDDDTSNAVIIDVRTPSSITALEVSDDMRPTARKLRLGDTVTFTFRLVDDDGDPVRKPGVKFTIDVKQSRNGRTPGPTTISKETGPDGTAEVIFRHADPSEDPGDLAQLDLDIRSSGGLDVSDRTTVGLVTNDGNSDDKLLDWADEPEEPTSIRLSVSKEYQVASSRGTGVGSMVRASLTDQYGSGVAGEAITFTSSDSSVVPRGVDRTTNVGGVATLHYQRDSASSATERITGRFEDSVATARQYWAAPIPGSTDGSGEVGVVDTGNNRAIVVTGDDVWLIEYDVGDNFKIDGDAVRIGPFEDDLTVGDTLAYEIAGSSESAVNSYTLTNR